MHALTALAIVSVCAVYLVALGATVVLIHIDIHEHRLPNRIVIPTGIVLAGLMCAQALGSLNAGRLTGAMLGGGALFALYVLLRAATHGGVGGGDVKLAAVLGLFLGWHGLAATIVGAAAGFVFAALACIVGMGFGWLRAESRIAFGPWMLLGAWTGLFLA